MEKKILQVPTDKSKIYRQIVGSLNFILNITEQQQDVLAEIIKVNNEYILLEEKKRAKFVLSTEMRKEMRERIGLPDKQFNNVLHQIKKKTLMGIPIIDEENVLHPFLLVAPDAEGFKVEVILSLKDSIKVERSQPLNPPSVSATENTPQAEKPLAKPANGTEGIINNTLEDEITLI
jgi:hypothetical protein